MRAPESRQGTRVPKPPNTKENPRTGVRATSLLCWDVSGILRHSRILFVKDLDLDRDFQLHAGLVDLPPICVNDASVRWLVLAVARDGRRGVYESLVGPLYSTNNHKKHASSPKVSNFPLEKNA